MRHLGLALIVIGFLGGCLAAVVNPEEIRWGTFVPLLSLGIVGVILVQISIKRQATGGGMLEANLEDLGAALAKLVEASRALEQDKLGIDLFDIPGRIEAVFPADINAFVDVRDAMTHTWGTQVYGEIMSHFAAGERYLNRVWSAASDGYIDEAHEYIGRTREQFEEAQRRFEAARAAAS
jgi:uncharacterized membrane protein YeaQ/YmgE (transglycosylase-associated protein family)